MNEDGPVTRLKYKYGRLPVASVAIIVVVLAHQACALLPALPATPFPPTRTTSPSPKPPTPPPAPTLTLDVSPEPRCDIAATLREVKAAVPYDEFVVHFNKIAGTASLAVWYVDPEVNPSPSAEGLAQQLGEVRLRAAEVSAAVGAASQCSSILFDVINPIVVDAQYQGWFSGTIRPADLPRGPEFSDEEISNAADNFSIGYLRSALQHPYLEGACEWPEARDRLQSHFSVARENVAFYFVIDDSGSHVWVQWDGHPEPTMTIVNLGNIYLALECFRPDADIIYIIVGDDGLALEIGLIPQRDAARLTILYP